MQLRVHAYHVAPYAAMARLKHYGMSWECMGGCAKTMRYVEREPLLGARDSTNTQVLLFE